MVKNYSNSANRAKAQIAYPAKGLEKKYELLIDTIIIPVGYISDVALYEEMKGNHVYLIGDACQPSNVMNAVWKTYEIAKDI